VHNICTSNFEQRKASQVREVKSKKEINILTRVDDRIVLRLLVKGFFDLKRVCPEPVEFTETFANKSIERRVGLGALAGASRLNNVSR
jgi:hypothetical protein